tara:strand:- start:742 stop:1062 length:321 start_codon:yes stop_codon:yes gene_type:complete
MTPKQRKALELYLRELSDALNAAGLDMRKTLKPGVEIPWSEGMAKDHLWRPIQKIMVDVESTTELEDKDVSAIYAVLDRHISAKHGIHIEFPSEERMAMEALRAAG